MTATQPDTPPGSGTAPGDIDAILALIRKEARAADREDAGEAGFPHVRRRGALAIVPALSPDDGTDDRTDEAGETADGEDTVLTYGRYAALSDPAFLETAYRDLLGRPVDPASQDSLMAALAAGTVSRADILSGLMRSSEGRGRGLHIRGLRARWLAGRMARLPVIGRLLAPFLALVWLRSDLAFIDQRFSTADARHRRLVEEANRSLDAIRSALREIEMLLHANAETAREASERAEARADAAAAEIRANRAVILNEKRVIEDLIAPLKAGMGAGPADETASRERASGEKTGLEKEAGAAHRLDDLYLALENRFRGSTAEIAARSRRYLPLIGGLAPVREGRDVLDIGCGRGEWLKQLGDAGLRARGVDLNIAMVDAARQAGQEAMAGDAIAHLESLAAGSLGAVTGFHVIEHLAFADLVRLLDATRRALAPGGAILFETPNPECITVGAYSFHLDPTHVRPLPPVFAGFLAEARGFGEVRIIRTDADCDLEADAAGFQPVDVNDWFQMPLDYAVFARKA